MDPLTEIIMMISNKTGLSIGAVMFLGWAIQWLFGAAVQSMPDPQFGPESSFWSRWAYNLMHWLAANWRLVLKTNEKQKRAVEEVGAQSAQTFRNGGQ